MKELTEEDLIAMEPKNEIKIDKDGMPMIVLRQPQFVKVRFIEFPTKFSKLQEKKEIDFFEQIIKDLEDIFKG